ncbi:hypothetical protein AVMA1855_23320 [Acidovorax sp. SUPP1855]|uniref:hypothetical protein n=1 Tax=Acidovorax sp. SUPP1855 TaxID=431774 RepID=UPI0023DE6206|nr:hypothetical protein [Acidovorax sp. SUPP1855]GKS87138.1 hypothetical protein AVMA1855_23320 [Acidovorax sp. SUPP1855]
MTTGDSVHSRRDQIADATIAACAAWTDKALASGKPEPLFAPVADYAAQALRAEGALVVTVFGRAPQVGKRVPLVTFGVAQRSRQAERLWRLMMQGVYSPVPHLARPPVPWCAAGVYASAASDMEALSWIGQFEQAVAWAWITRSPVLESVR